MDNLDKVREAMGNILSEGFVRTLQGIEATPDDMPFAISSLSPIVEELLAIEIGVRSGDIECMSFEGYPHVMSDPTPEPNCRKCDGKGYITKTRPATLADVIERTMG